MLRVSIRTLLAAATLLVGLTAALPSNAQPNGCGGLTGAERSACNRALVRQATERNRALSDAAYAAQNPAAAAAADAGASPMRSVTGSSPPALTTAEGKTYERPVINRETHPATMIIILHVPRQAKPAKLRYPVSRGCYYADNPDLAFDRACKLDSLQNTKAATPLFKEACDFGDPSGCFMYADHIESRSRAEAQALYIAACDAGHADACYRIGLAYEKGEGLPKDAAQTRIYYQRACDAGNDYGCRYVAGKVDAACPHGYRSYRADLNKNTYKVMCVVSTGPLLTEEHEIPASPAEIADMKRVARYNQTLPKWMVDAFDDIGGRGSGRFGDCSKNDIAGSDGRPISGSGCIGR